MAMLRSALISTLLLAKASSAQQAPEQEACPAPPENEVYTRGVGGIASVNTTDGASPTVLQPLVVKSGCRYRISLDTMTEAYFSIPRGAGERVRIEWDYEALGGLPVHAFTWNGQCCGGRHPYAAPPNTFYADDIHEPTVRSGEYTFPFSQMGRDFYHCEPACRLFSRTEKVGTLMITVSSFYSNTPVFGDFTVFVESTTGKIKPSQLAVVKDLYDTCCSGRRPPNEGWSWQSSANTDTDTKPYCDWLGLQAFPQGLASIGEQPNCSEIPGVICDSAGDVAELILPGLGLKCDSLPSSLAQLTNLRSLDLSQNQIEGSLPADMLALPSLQIVLLQENRLQGPPPCFDSDYLEVLRLANNDITGSIPSCYGQHPRLNWLDLSGNRIAGSLPANLGRRGSSLMNLDLSLNLLDGVLPAGLCDIGQSLAFLSLSRNSFAGELPPCYLTSFRNIIELDLSYNRLNGTLPTLSPNLQKLRSLRLQHNRLSGAVAAQFDTMVRNLISVGSGRSVILLNSNRFSGPLPTTMEDLIHNKNFYVVLQMGGNHLRCDDVSHTWPRFVRKVPLPPDVLGSCERVPTLESLRERSYRAGQSVHVLGHGFDKTDDLHCQFINRGVTPNVALTSLALFISPNEVHCSVPEMAIGTEQGSSVSPTANAEVLVTVANYGNDYAQVKTIGTSSGENEYLSFILSCPEMSAGSECQYTRGATCSGHGMPKFDGSCECDGGFKGGNCSKRSGVDETLALGIGLPVCLIATCAVAFIAYMIRRERRGVPLFTALDDLIEPNAMRSDQSTELGEVQRPPMEIRIAERKSQAIAESLS